MFKIRTSKYRHVFCDAPKQEVSFEIFYIANNLGADSPMTTNRESLYCN